MTAEEIVRALAAMPDRWFDDTCEFCGVDAYGGDLTTHSPGCAYAAAKRWVAEHPVSDAADATWETVDLRTARWVSVGEPCGDRHGSWVCDLPYSHDGFHATHRDGYLYRLWPDDIR